MKVTMASISISICIAVALSTTTALAQSATPTTYTKQTVTLEAANAAVVASLAKSRELGVLSVVAVYDEGGTLKALATMDGARYTGVQFALDKAWTAARRQAATQDLADAMAMGPEMNWHSFLKQPQTTLLGGGLPDPCRRPGRRRHWLQRRHDCAGHRNRHCGPGGNSALVVRGR